MCHQCFWYGAGVLQGKKERTEFIHSSAWGKSGQGNLTKSYVLDESTLRHTGGPSLPFREESRSSKPYNCCQIQDIMVGGELFLSSGCAPNSLGDLFINRSTQLSLRLTQSEAFNSGTWDTLMGRGGEPLTNTFSFCIYGCDYPREQVKAAFYKLDLIPKANELWELGSNTKKK